MRIIWNEEHSWFQAELTQGELWQDDKDSLQAAGFRTEGPPSWIWYCTRSKPLNKLRDLKPKSGIVLTELALEKYNFLEKKLAEKTALKKQAQKILKETEQTSVPVDMYFDEELGFMCIVVKPSESKFVWTPPVHLEPAAYCVICGSGLGLMDYNDVCLWCDKQQKGLDKQK